MSFDLNTIKDLVAEGYDLNAQASGFLISQLEQVTAELDAAAKNHRKHAARLITEKVVVMEERDALKLEVEGQMEMCQAKEAEVAKMARRAADAENKLADALNQRDELLTALTNLLCESGRSKMLDSKAEGKAADALAKAGAQ